jgi:hypothetical protein
VLLTGSAEYSSGVPQAIAEVGEYIEVLKYREKFQIPVKISREFLCDDLAILE